MGLFEITIDDMIAEVQRELAMRRHVYPRLVQSKKMTKEQMDHRMEAMQSVADLLVRHRDQTK